MRPEKQHRLHTERSRSINLVDFSVIFDCIGPIGTGAKNHEM